MGQYLEMTNLEYQDGGDELQNLITEITAMRDPGLFISVVSTKISIIINFWYELPRILVKLNFL